MFREGFATIQRLDELNGERMANRYGEAAIMATRQVPSAAMTAPDRWEHSMKKLYPTSESARSKGGPREAYLGLCEDGLVKGVPAGKYTRSSDDKLYATRAVALLTEGKQHWTVSTLWREVTGNEDKAHNSQMDVVFALWKNNLIVLKS